MSVSDFFRKIENKGNPGQVMAVGTACWFGPSETIRVGLQQHCARTGLRLKDVKEKLPPGVAAFYAHDALVPVSTEPHPAPLIAPLPKDLCYAILRDHKLPIEASWSRLTAHQRTTVVTTAAALGANQILLAVLRRNAPLLGMADGGAAQNTPLHYAAMASRVQAVQILLEQARVSASPSNPVQTHPLHDAARAGNLAIVKLLLAHGADPTARNHYQDTVLHRCALFACHPNATAYGEVLAHVVHALCATHGHSAAQCMLNAPNCDGFTPLDIAVVRKQEHVAQCLTALGAQHGQRYLSQPTQWQHRDVDHTSMWNDKAQQLDTHDAGQAA